MSILAAFHFLREIQFNRIRKTLSPKHNLNAKSNTDGFEMKGETSAQLNLYNGEWIRARRVERGTNDGESK